MATVYKNDNSFERWTMAEDNSTMVQVIWRWRKTFERWRGAIVKQAMEIPVYQLVFDQPLLDNCDINYM